MNKQHYNFAYLDEQTKRMIRRAILKGIAVPGYQVPFASREMPMPYGWGTGGVQVTQGQGQGIGFILGRQGREVEDPPDQSSHLRFMGASEPDHGLLYPPG